MASDISNDSFKADPLHPFDAKWYVRDASQTLGPYEGHRVKEMIEQGRLDAESLIALVGATEWSSVKDVPAFAALLGGASGAGPAVFAETPGTAAASSGTLRYAGFWVRFFAYIVDVIILEVLVIIASGLTGLLIGLIAAGIAARGGEKPALSDAIGAISVLIGFGISIAYYFIFVSGRWQATPGKRLLGIHIIAVNGQRIDGWLAFRRWFCYIVSALPLWIGFMVIGWNDQKKAFHDSICETRVVYGKL